MRERSRGWGEARWDGEWLEMEEERGFMGREGGFRGSLASKRAPKAGLAASITILEMNY